MGMKKFPHKIKPNPQTSQPYRFIFFDTETIEMKINNQKSEVILRLGWALFWQRKYRDKKEKLEWCFFNSISQFWDFVNSKANTERTLYLIAHNIQFDMLVLNGFKELKKRGFELKTFIINNKVVIWSFIKGRKRIIFLDNYNYFQFSLKELGEIVGLKKLEMPDFTDDDEKWKIYCKRDVEILYKTWKLLLDYIEKYDMGKFAKTLAGQSFNCYRHRFLKHKIYVHNFPEVLKLERESYRGGRNECFFIGKLPKDDYYLLDVNSMYPYVMKQFPYPVKCIGLTKWIDKKELSELLEKYCLIGRFYIKTDEPVFGIRYKRKLIFPVGSFWATLTTREIEYALSYNYIERVDKVAIYKKEYIFRDFVDYFYHLRLEEKYKGNHTLATFHKLILNSLYGKFGQRNEVWKTIKDGVNLPDGYIEEGSDVDGKFHRYRVINGRLDEVIGKEESFNSFPAIASEVCANGRLHLWWYIRIAGFSNVLYCDTDSLIVNKKGYENLRSHISPDRIGGLKVVAVSKDVEIRKPKFYRFGDLIKAKGVKASAKRINEWEYLTDRFVSVKGCLKRKDLTKLIIEKVVLHFKKGYDKGVLQKTGKIVPYRVVAKEIDNSDIKILNLS